MLIRNRFLSATALASGALMGTPAYANCTVPEGSTDVTCTGAMSARFEDSSDDLNITVEQTQTLDTASPLITAVGENVSVAVEDGAGLNNANGGDLFLGRGATVLIGSATLTSGSDAIVMDNAGASFDNSGTINAADRALWAGTLLGDFANSGTMTGGSYGVVIDGLAESVTGKNSGTINGTWGGLYVGIDDAAFENSGTISATGSGNDVAAVELTGGGTFTNTETGKISAANGIGITSHYGVDLDNGGKIEGSTAVDLGYGSTLNNGETGTIVGSETAISMTSGSNHIDNAGVIETSSPSANATVVVGSSSPPVLTVIAPSTIRNEAGGRIGNAANTAANIAIAASSNSGPVDVVNYGTINGSIDLTHANPGSVYNGIDQNGSFGGAGEAHILGDITFNGDSSNHLENAGEITGDVTFGQGNDTVVFWSTGNTVLNGDIDLGDGDNMFELTEAMNGNVTFGSGNDELVIDSATELNGTVTMGGGADTLVLDNAQADVIATGNKFEGGGDAGDTIVLRGSAGGTTTDGWNANQFSGFANIVKEGGDHAILSGNWTGISTLKIGTTAATSEDTLVLSEGASMSGAATVGSNGVYELYGTHNGAIDVLQGGQLMGYGRSGSVTNAGIFAVGDDHTLNPHSFAIDGDFVQTATGELDIRLGEPGESDVLDISGSAKLDGAVQFIPVDTGVSGDYTFLLADGGVSGTFASLNPDGDVAQGNFFSYSVDYSQANQVTVHVNGGSAPTPTPPTPTPTPPTPTPTPPTPTPPTPTPPTPTPPTPTPPTPTPTPPTGELTSNQLAAYGSLAASGAVTTDLAMVRAALNSVSLPVLQGAMDSLGGEIYASAPAAFVRDGRVFAQTIDSRLSGSRDFNAQGGGIWAAALGSWGRVNGDGNAHRTTTGLTGLAMGVDGQFGNVRAGLAGGHSSDHVRINALDSAARLSSWSLAGYAGATFGSWFVDGQLDYSRVRMGAHRTLITGATSFREANGHTHGDQWGASLRTGAPVAGGPLTIRPYAFVDASSVSFGSFVETGAGDAGLDVRNAHASSFNLGVGSSFEGRLPAGSVTLVPYADVSAAEEVGRGGYSATTHFIGGGVDMHIRGAEPGRTQVMGAIGLRSGGDSPLGFDIGYRIRTAGDFVDNEAHATVSLRW